MAESIMLDKAKDFAVEIINMCKDIKETKRESVLTNQLMRSGTSISKRFNNRHLNCSLIINFDIQGIKSYEQVCGQIEKMLLNYELICV